MSTNQKLAKIFAQMASALELLGENRFRVQGDARVARVLEDLGEDVRVLAGDDEPAAAIKQLAQLPGIGKGSAEKIVEYLNHGQIAEHQQLLAKVPPGLFDVLEIPGIGPKAAKLMWEQLGIRSVADLKTKLDTPEFAALPRMGEKTIDNIRKAIAFSEQAEERIPLGLARPIAVALVAELAQVPGVQQADFAGSLRRGRETIGDLDFLVACQDPELVRERFTSSPAVTQVLARGETKCSTRLAVGGVHLQADLRLVPKASYGAALLYFTGSKEHNVRLREFAIKRGMRLNEYGLFPGTDERPQESGVAPVAALTEEEIYRALDLPWIAPELREDRGELTEEPRRLIELQDIRAELHAHTVASDGRLTIAEMAREARDRGFHTLAITDHSQSSVIANGLSPERLLRHLEAVREADAKIDGITLLAGAEVDILIDGRLDYEDDLLAQLDVVVASPHASLRQAPEVATERLLRAIRHPLVHILGHPTGRIIQRREGLAPDLHALFQAAAEHDTVLELNANWQRLDLRDGHLRMALERGCRIAIDTDAHEASHFDFLIYGILTARRAGLAPEDCINTWPAERLHQWLRSKR